MTEDEWQALQDGFDTRQLLDAIGDLDQVRGALADDGHQPPEIRNRLFKLHELAMAVINEGSEHEAGAMFELATELEDEVADMLEALTRLHDTLGTLTTLRPDSRDDEDGGTGDDDDA